MRKILGLLAVILLLILSYIFNIYSANYPSKLRSNLISFDFDAKVFIYAFVIILFLSTLFAFIPLKNKIYSYKFFTSFFIFSSIFMIINFIGNFKQYFDKKNEFENLLVKTNRQAKSDIQKGLIKYYYFGGDSILDNTYSNHPKLQYEIDSLTRTYGVVFLNEGGSIDLISLELNKKYKEYTESYLEKRNGKNWKLKMEEEIETIKQKYRNR
ncbi:FEKKY domain-containing protein [Chryseobacterium kwangjuense]|uniref:Uncharacterized protein n=1 Tax=Chryseobacterium kwangjuense TaxID=267125 RepID=A0A135WDH4_9FLAO|nr:hypothetical protein [Chryseobacterium kwangjuense]KXH82956.1 hypothetical protein AU378_10995 [Chryseobacterium kwangjuense]